MGPFTAPFCMPVYTDSFSQSNENPLSSGGVWDGGYAGLGNMQVVSNKISAATVNVDERMTYNGLIFPSDQFAQATVKTWNTSSGASIIGFHLLLRYAAPTAQTGYEIVIRRIGGADNISVISVIAGTPTTLGAGASITVAVNDIFKAIVIDNQISVFQNGILRYTPPTDVTTVSGRIGIGAFINVGGATGDVEIDDFSGGALRITPIKSYRPRPFAPGIAR